MRRFPLRARRHRVPVVAAIALALGSALAPALPAASATAGVALSQSRDSEPTGSVHTVNATATGADGSPVPDGTTVTFTISGPERAITVGAPLADVVLTSDGRGAWILRQDGAVTAVGTARHLGDSTGTTAVAVAIAATATDNGYWIALSDGRIRALGDAGSAGSLSSPPATAVVDLAAHPSGDGYWLVTAGGTVYAFGTALAYGDATPPQSGKPVLAIASTVTGNGYWVVDARGAVSNLGDATFFGDTHAITLNQPIVAFAVTPDGRGYWFVAGDGGIFSFGSAKFSGSTGGRRLPAPIVALAPDPTGGGYVLAGRDGMLYPFDVPALTTGYPVPARSGRAALRFSSSSPGVSTVGASVAATGAVAAPLDVRWLAGPPASITLSSGTGFVGQPLLFTAEVRDAGGYPVDPTTVEFVATAPGGERLGPVTATTENGTARATFSSDRTGEMTVTASAAHLVAARTVSWAQAPPGPPPTKASAVNLSPAEATVGPGNVHTVTATVTGADGQAVVDGTPVTFTVSGPSSIGITCAPVVGFAVTPATGRGRFLHANGRIETVSGAGREVTPVASASVAVDLASSPAGGGYWIATGDGRVVPVDGAEWYGDVRNEASRQPILRIISTPSGRGYWLLHRDGSVSAFGDAPFLGSKALQSVPAPAVSLVATPSGAGYWLVGADGSVYAFGDAAHLGHLAAVRLNKPIVDAAPTATGRGYWLVANDGGIFSFGDARFFGSTGAVLLPTPIFRFAPSATGGGYHMVTSGGAIWSFGDAPQLLGAGETCVRSTVNGRATLQFSSAVPGPSEIAAHAHGASATARVEWRDGGGTGAAGNAGYWMLGADGAVYSFGTAPFFGRPELQGAVEAVDLEPTPSGRGYWVLDASGAVHLQGDAVAHGNAAAGTLAPGERVTSLSATPSGAGYWIFTTRGRVLPFGDARFFGDVSAVALNGPVLDSIPTPSGLGYYMVASDGGIFTFGDAAFLGSMGGVKLNKPVQSLVPDADGHGYWLVASDGGIFAFHAPFRGSLGDVRLNKPIKGMVRYGDGYLMVGTDGGIFAFSNQPFAGSLGANPPAKPIVAVAAAR